MTHDCPTHGAEYDCPIPKNCTHPRVVNCPPCHRKTGQLYPKEPAP